MLELLSSGFRVSALMFVFCFGFVFLRYEKQSFKKNILVGFLVTLVGYLLAYWEPVKQFTWLLQTSFFLSVSLPFAFWLASKAVFDDNFRWSAKYWLLVISMPVVCNVLYGLGHVLPEDIWQNIRFTPYLLSMFFIVLVVYEAVKGRENDLIIARLSKRNVFVLFSSFMALFSVYLFFVEDPLKLPVAFDAFQNFVTAIFLFLFFYSNGAYRNIFAEDRLKKQSAEGSSLVQKAIIAKILDMFEVEKVFLQEGITISVLSEMVNEKEYLVRKAINGELGYSNFNTFLNHYRIKEACRIMELQQNENIRFQEIAFQLGYQSVATFNRAFKNETEMTPTQYIKQVRTS
ncbi:AraC family transcriptional regulator [Prolixibacteraceae bacterium JC049]|nr:AraC family transcriptional regulator [Prolixibacteraceae bacterium JC049]